MLYRSQEAFAQELTEKGVPTHQTSVGRLEYGERRLTVEDLLAVAATLGVSPLHLLAGTYTSERVPVLPTLPPYVPARMIAWLRGEVALPGTNPENFATALPSRVLYAHLQSGIRNLERILSDYREADERGDDGAKDDALHDLIREAERQVADRNRADNSIEKETENGNH
jgi:transcriptional regulator with XRE-family HTH domain